jgi:hypothetical protein
MKDKELKLEETEASHTIGGSGEGIFLEERICHVKIIWTLVRICFSNKRDSGKCCLVS